MSSIKPRLGPGLGAGWTEQRGQVASQPVLMEGTRMDDRIGYRFSVVLRTGLAVEVGDALAARDVVTVSDLACKSWLDKLGVMAVVVRPDHYVFGAARNVAEPHDLVARL